MRTSEQDKIAQMISDSANIYAQPPPGIKRTTGIPRSFLKPATVDTPGAKINPQG